MVICGWMLVQCRWEGRASGEGAAASPAPACFPPLAAVLAFHAVSARTRRTGPLAVRARQNANRASARQVQLPFLSTCM